MSFNDALYEVLQQSRYDRLTGRSLDIRGLIEDALIRFITFLLDRFDISWPERAGINTDAAAVFFAVAGGVILITTIIFFARHRRIRRKTVKPELADVFEEIIKRDLTAEEWLALSQRQYNAGAYREAVRYRYMGALAALHRRKIIKLQASKTNAQIAGELAAAAPGLVPFFAAATDCFHRVWFGYKPLGEGEFARLSAAVGELV